MLTSLKKSDSFTAGMVAQIEIKFSELSLTDKVIINVFQLR
jgi:hypothetical protein